MKRRLRWRVPDGGLGLTAPGEPFVRLVILCSPCDRAGRKRTLAVFEMDTGDAGRTVWVVPRRVPGNGPQIGLTTAVPVIRGTGDAARVKLICGVKAARGGKSSAGCPNTPDVSVAWIAAELSAMGDTRETKYVLR
jgi:hypothetical protein